MLSHHEANALIEVLIAEQEMDAVLKYGIIGKLVLIKCFNENL